MNWYQVMFPDAETEERLIPLYSIGTPLGRWEIRTPVRTFRYQPTKEQNDFFLFWSDNEEPHGLFHDVHDAIRAVCSHSTGVEMWDDSSLGVSDYLLDWKREVPDRIVFNYIDYWIQRNPEGTLRDMVDYFEHDDTHLVDRTSLGDCLEEMIVNGQMTSFPRVWMPPADLRHVIELAKEYRIPVRDDRQPPKDGG